MNTQPRDCAPPPQVTKWRIIAGILALMLVVLLTAFATLMFLGWKIYRPERPGTDAPNPGRAQASAETWSPPLGSGEGAATRIKRLGQQLASLSLGTTNRPDPGAVLAEAQSLAAKGQYEQALQRHIWYHNHALEYDPGQTGVRLSFALSYWIELSRKYPKAREALLEIRDHDGREFAEGRGYFALFLELSSINAALQAKDNTVAVYKGIVEKDPELAKQCYPLAEDLLVEKQEYALCLSFIPDPQARFNFMREELQRRSRMPFATPQMQAKLQNLATNRFVTQVRTLAEILVASGRKEEAQTICSEALTVMADRRLTSAVADAEKRLAK